MQFTYEVKGGMYIYKGPRSHGGFAYSLHQINDLLTKAYGADGYALNQL